jgi:HEAT repeat protein
MPSLKELFDEVETLGREMPFWPVDIMRIAMEFSQHPESKHAVAGLQLFLDDNSNFIRHVGLRALRLIQGAALDAGTVQRATIMIRTDEAPNVRAEAARLLLSSGTGSKSVREALALAATSDAVDYVRHQAAEALRGLGIHS